MISVWSFIQHFEIMQDMVPFKSIYTIINTIEKRKFRSNIVFLYIQSCVDGDAKKHDTLFEWIHLMICQ